MEKENYKFKKYYDGSKHKRNYESKMRTRDPRITNYRLDNGQLSEQCTHWTNSLSILSATSEYGTRSDCLFLCRSSTPTDTVRRPHYCITVTHHIRITIITNLVLKTQTSILIITYTFTAILFSCVLHLSF